MAVNEQIINIVKGYLAESKKSQRLLASEMDMHETYMSLLLSGKRKWTMRLVSLFVERTGCKVII